MFFIGSRIYYDIGMDSLSLGISPKWEFYKFGFSGLINIEFSYFGQRQIFHTGTREFIIVYLIMSYIPITQFK